MLCHCATDQLEHFMNMFLAIKIQNYLTVRHIKENRYKLCSENDFYHAIAEDLCMLDISIVITAFDEWEYLLIIIYNFC